MYKTVRQGENSLQYTILPQQDEGRAGAGPAVSHRRANGGQRPGAGRKRSILAYIGLFFVCAIITFAILIPLMVTSDLMPTPTAWFYRNQKGRDFRKMTMDGRSADHIIKSGTPLRTTAILSTTVTPPVSSTTVTTSTTTTTTTTERPSTKGEEEHHPPLWTDVITVTEFEKLYKNDESMERLGGNSLQDEEDITTTTRITTTPTSRPATKNYPKHFSLQKHEKAAVGDTQPERKTIQVNTNTDDMTKAHQNWLQSHWSYVDPYLQWKNYAADDRVVLPLILGVALTTVIIVILMCYLVKRKRLCGLCRKSNNRNAFQNVEAQEDHENLLTNENQSEEE